MKIESIDVVTDLVMLTIIKGILRVDFTDIDMMISKIDYEQGI
jgi:hypothetical protein